ncbi:MAG: glycosyltransferase family 39 protein, partial [Victivallales bacterium]|nr:glycosyltransferase family 39 protein [Victivallales bacterium]
MNSEPKITMETQGRTPWAGLCFIAILFLTLALRTVNLSTNPNGLQIDEASIAYNAYLVGQTGKDEKGNSFPLYPQSSWNPKHPVYFYPAVLSVRLLGLNRIGARATAVFFGMLAVVAVYFLALELFGAVHVALLSAFLLAVSPWHVHFSRFGVEVSSFPATFILSLLFLLRGLKRHPANLILGAVFAGATFYSYPIALVFVPLFLAGFLLIYRARLRERTAWAAAAVFIIAATFVPVAGSVFNRTGMTSYVQKTSITGELFHSKTTEHLLAKGDPVSRAIASSRFTRSAYGFVTNYFGYVRPAFLFLRGDTVSILHNDGRHGMTLYGSYFFMLIGLFSFARRRGKSGLVILWWFLMFPVGASLM